MQLLLMTEQQVAARKASCAVRALERLLLCMRALVALQMLQPGKGATASGADMGPRLVCLGRRDIAIGASLTIGLGLFLGLLGRSYRCGFRIGGSVSLYGLLVLTRHICGNFVDACEIRHVGAMISVAADHSI